MFDKRTDPSNFVYTKKFYICLPNGQHLPLNFACCRIIECNNVELGEVLSMKLFVKMRTSNFIYIKLLIKVQKHSTTSAIFTSYNVLKERIVAVIV